MKFGGTSLDDGDAIARAVGIVREYRAKGHQVVVVPSALRGVTDALDNIGEKAATGDIDGVSTFVRENLELHNKAATECIRNLDILGKVLGALSETSKELEETLRSVGRLRELTPRAKDFLLSFGEKLSAPIVCGAGVDLGLMAQWLTGGDAGITTDENFGEANPLMDVTTRLVKSRLEPLLKDGKVPIVAGYGACSPHGITTTLGRGGSDYTATLLGAALDADEVWIWKTVEGLMTADPIIEPRARTLRKLSYAEACEMAYFGAKAIHPKALLPVWEKQIPVRIKSSIDSSSEGTLVAGDSVERSEGIVKAITLVAKVAMISVTGAGMIGLPGMAARVFRVLGDAGTNILMISQSSSDAGISFVVPREKLQRATNALELGILGTEPVKNIASENDVCVIAAVGAEMKGTPGVAARVFKAVADEGVNVRMIAQGSSELNISFVVAEKDGPKAVRALHKEFKLGT